MRKRLRTLDAEHGGKLLSRDSDAPNAKVWVDREKLAELWPTRFAPGAYLLPEEERIRVAEDLARTAEELARKARQELEDLRREGSREGRARKSGRKSEKK